MGFGNLIFENPTPPMRSFAFPATRLQPRYVILRPITHLNPQNTCPNLLIFVPLQEKMKPTDDQIRAILSEFTHPERMQSSQLFKNIVVGIAHGRSLHSIIEDLLTVIENQNRHLREISENRPIYGVLTLDDEQMKLLKAMEAQKEQMGQTSALSLQVADNEYKRLMKALYP